MKINSKEDRAKLAYQIVGLVIENPELALNISRLHDMLGGEFDGQELFPESFVDHD